MFHALIINKIIYKKQQQQQQIWEKALHWNQSANNT